MAVSGTVAMAVPGTAPKYRIIDAQCYTWINDPQYPWAAETKNPPKEDRTPAMLLELMNANDVQRTVIAQYIGYLWDNRYALDFIKKYEGSRTTPHSKLHTNSPGQGTT